MAAKGELTHGRQKDIGRLEGGLMHFVRNWEDRRIISASTIAQMTYSQRDLITECMKPILDVLNKEQHLKTVKGQFRGYFEMAVSEPVRCWEKNGVAIETLMNTVVGDMKPKDLKTTINSTTIGKLNKYLGMLRTFVKEEMDENIRCANSACAVLVRKGIAVTCVLPPPVCTQRLRGDFRPDRLCRRQLEAAAAAARRVGSRG